jgi:transcriptional regulator with XRE-family HTH domain
MGTRNPAPAVPASLISGARRHWTMPSSSSVQRARQALADRLREVRLDAGLTARALSAAAGWHEAKTSRIEHARVAPSDADIRMWCEVCGANGQVPDLLAASHAVDSMWTAWRRLERPGLRRAQEAVIPLWERTPPVPHLLAPCLIPGPVQTAGYIETLLQAIRERRPNRLDDIEEAVRVRLAKQWVTYEPDRSFTILLEENALRHRIGGPDILRGHRTHSGRSGARRPLACPWAGPYGLVQNDLVLAHVNTSCASALNGACAPSARSFARAGHKGRHRSADCPMVQRQAPSIRLASLKLPSETRRGISSHSRTTRRLPSGISGQSVLVTGFPP